MSTRALIMAGGPAERWDNYLGVPKHIVKLPDGDTLIKRTVKQLQYFHIKDIIIVGPPVYDCRYHIAGTKYACSQRIGPAAVYELMNPELMHFEGRTLIVLGDVFFSNYAMDVICNEQHDFRLGYTWFGRKKASQLTGCKHAEIFAISFSDTLIDEIVKGLTANLYKVKQGDVDNAGGFELYAYLRGMPLRPRAVDKYFVDINDLTDDFDCKADYDNWRKAYANIFGK